MTDDKKIILGLAGLAAVAVIGTMLVNKARDSLPDSPKAAAENIGGAVVDVVTGVVVGAVNKVGDVFGVPMVDDKQCVIDLTNGDTFAAMSSCNVGTFAKYMLDGTIPGVDQVTGQVEPVKPEGRW